MSNLTANWACWGSPGQGARSHADFATYGRLQVVDLADQGNTSGATADGVAPIDSLFAILSGKKMIEGSPDAVQQAAWVLQKTTSLQTTLASEGLPMSFAMGNLLTHARAAKASTPDYAGWQMATPTLAFQADGVTYQQQRMMHALGLGDSNAAVQGASIHGDLIDVGSRRRRHGIDTLAAKATAGGQ